MDKEKMKYYQDRSLYQDELRRQQENVRKGYQSREQAQGYMDWFCVREGIERKNIEDIEEKFV